MISWTGKRLTLTAAVAFSVLASGAGIALMGVSAWLLSRAAEHPPVLYLMVAIVAVRALGLSRGVFRYLERLTSHDVALRLQSELRQSTYTRLARNTWLGRRSGDLLGRVLLDVEAVQDLVVRVLIPNVSAAVVVLATTTALMVMSPTAGALVLASAVAAGALLPWLTAVGSRRTDLEMAPLRADLASAVAGVAASATDITAYGAQHLVGGQLALIDARLRFAERRAALVRGLTSAGQVAAAGGAVVCGLLVGGRAVADGVMPGVFLAVLVLTPVALHETLVGLPAAAQTWTRVRASLLRVQEVIDAPPVGAGDAVRVAEAGRPELSLTNATLGWPGRAPVLRGLTLDVRAGERVCLMGATGVGKTTVAATVMGLIPLLAGDMVVAGRPGYLAQDGYIFDSTVAENVRIGRRDATDADVRTALASVGLDLALDRLVGEHGTALSGGEARRLALARLLLEDHPIFIFDEPTEHLDRATAQEMIEVLIRASRHSATVIITHDPDLAARCTRTIHLSGPVAPGHRVEVRSGAPSVQS